MVKKKNYIPKPRVYARYVEVGPPRPRFSKEQLIAAAFERIDNFGLAARLYHMGMTAADVLRMRRSVDDYRNQKAFEAWLKLNGDM